VAEHGSVTAAAGALSLTQPAVSNRLRTLEAVVGGPVVARRGRRAVLTDLGEQLLPHAQAIVRSTARAGIVASSVREGHLHVRVALSEASIPLVMPRLAACASDGDPPLTFSVLPRDARSAVGAVIAGEVDLAVAVAWPEPPADDLHRRPILFDEIVLVRAGEQEAEADLGIVPPLRVLWQAPGSGVRATAEWILEANGIWPESSLDLGSSLGALAAAAAGEGAAFLPRSYAEPWVTAGRVAVTSLRATDLFARFELISEPADQLTASSRRIFDALIKPHPR
jgi:DNA-binding transcriptional LysR family regulator